MSNLLNSIATISAAVAAVKAIRWYSEYAHEKAIQDKRQAFRHYVETGEQNAAYRTLSSRAVKAARRQRRTRIAERTKQSASFSTICECPKCLSFDFHTIQTMQRRGCIRQCQSCYYQWRQK